MTVVLVRSYSRYSATSWCDSEHGRPRVAQRLADGALVRRVGVGVQKADRDGLRPPAADGPHRGADGVLLQRGQDRAVERHPLHDAGAPGAGHERVGLGRLQRVEVGACLAADLENVLEPGGGEQHHARPFALEHGVGSHGGAVRDLDAATVGRSGLRQQDAQSFGDRAGGIIRRRQLLVNVQAPALEADEVGERATRIDTDQNHGAGLGSSRLSRSTARRATHRPAPARSKKKPPRDSPAAASSCLRRAH